VKAKGGKGKGKERQWKWIPSSCCCFDAMAILGDYYLPGRTAEEAGVVVHGNYDVIHVTKSSRPSK
jgi:hypothetical protein